MMDGVFRNEVKEFISPPVVLAKFLGEALQVEKMLHEEMGMGEAKEELWSVDEDVKPPHMGAGEGNAEELEAGTSGSTDRARELCKRLLCDPWSNNQQRVERCFDNLDNELKELQALQSGRNGRHFDLSQLPPHSPLEMHKELRRIHTDYPDTTIMKNLLVNRGKYFKWAKRALAPPKLPCSTPVKDILLTVHLLAPQNKPPERTVEALPYRMRCEMKFLVRGETLLSSLCDAITCPNALWNNRQVPNGSAESDADYDLGKFYPGRFLFVHDTFYMDGHRGSGKASDDGEDPLATIAEFHGRKQDQLGAASRHAMAGVRILDLTLRLGQPYLFQHVGYCQHLVIFSDLRTLNAYDEQQEAKYPIKVLDNRRGTFCTMCNRTMATLVVTSSQDRLPNLPFHFCAKCYDEFDLEGRCTAYHYKDVVLGAY